MWRERTALHRRNSQCSKRVHLDLFSWQFAMKTSECPSAVVDGEVFIFIYFWIPLSQVVSRMLSLWLVTFVANQPTPRNVTLLRNNGLDQWLISHDISSSRNLSSIISFPCRTLRWIFGLWERFSDDVFAFFFFVSTKHTYQLCGINYMAGFSLISSQS